jgi:hypothetical protein
MKRKEIKIGCPDLAITLLRDDNTFSERSLQGLEGRGFSFASNLVKRNQLVVE